MDEFIDEITALVRPLSMKAKVLFAALTSEKLYPNYVLFEQRTGWGNSKILQESLSSIYQYIFNENLLTPEDIHYYITQIDNVTPDTEDFDDLSTSFALDACTSLFSTLNFILSKDDNDILDVASYARDTVYAFLQAKEQFNSFDPSSEIQIEHDDFMIHEKLRQKTLLSKLSTTDLSIVTDSLIENLREKQPIIDLSLVSE